MISQILDRDFMLRQVAAFGEHLDREIQLHDAGDAAALERARAAGISGDDLRRARAELTQAATDPKAREIREGQQVFLPPDAAVSGLQTALEQQLLVRSRGLVAGPAELAAGSSPIADLSLKSDETVFEQFGPADIGWISSAFSALLKLFRGARPFTENPAPPCTTANTVRLILLADWGTGLPRARKVGEAARRYLLSAGEGGVEAHVIHLGDVYYSGWAAEYDAHFLPYWPVRPEEAERYGSWCLNGNHDMYSGGHGYFDHLLKDARFARQAQSSYFSLENDFWQILGLDTAYEDFDLAGGQAAWVEERRTAGAAKRGILLSHHQPFSAYEAEPGRIVKRLAPVLQRELILGWFWGHEHRCTWYGPRDHVRFGRCIGHGGVPVLAPTDPLPQGVTYEFGDWVVGTEPRLARFGFAVLDFAGERLHVEYVNEDGVPHNMEDLVSAAAGTGG